MLTQLLGSWRCPVSYLSKKLDSVAAEWLPYLRIIAATVLLVRDPDKLTFGQQLIVITPHSIKGVLKQPPSKWISNTCLTHYQGLLLDAPRILFQVSTSLDPATLLPTPDLEASLHMCSEILSEATSIRKDLKDQRLMIWCGLQMEVVL